ncbi:MAG: peptidylprolyl isomerase [Thiobacillus sp.]|nr:peptidylprolyl isomerase [Thiobacillus sp.]
MHRSLLAVPLLASLAFSALAADAPARQEADPKAPFAVVNGVAIPAIYAEFVRQNRLARNMPAELLSEESLREALVASELMVQEALKKGLDKEPTVAAALEFQRREILGKAALEDYARKNPVSEELVQAEYDKAKVKAGEKEYRARHILVKTEKEAKTLLAQLKKPKVKFEDLARKYSKDSSAKNGGDLDWTLPANLVPEFAQAMTALKKGETSSVPVQTKFGWHIIRLDDVRDLAFPPYDQIKGRIAGQLQQLAIRRHLQALRAEAKVE